MRIDHLNLPQKITEEFGLNPVNIERLGSVVALIGKNGSGKSRLLRLIEEQYLKKLSLLNIDQKEIVCVPNTIDKIITDFNNEYSLSVLEPQRNELNLQVEKNPNDADLRTRYNEIRKKINNTNNQSLYNTKHQEVNKKISKAALNYFIKITNAEIRNLKEAIDTVTDEKEMTFEKLIESITENDSNELSAVYSTGLTYLSNLPSELIEDQIECFNDFKKFEKKISYKRFTSLSRFIKIFLNKELTYDQKKINRKKSSKRINIEVEGLWNLDGRLFNYAELSDGEKVLFAYSLLFFLLDQNEKLKIQESIIFIDEPELHLHPESEYQVIEGIRRIIDTKGQLWIATHSISILSSLSYDEIFMLKKSVLISPKRTTPGESFVELMGLESHIDKLSHFVTNISNWAFLNFITQCFSNPEVIKCARENDPEFLLFKRSIKEIRSNSILLDFGAGQGRIYREIIKDNSLKGKINYSALEPNAENIEELKNLNLKIYQDYDDLPNSQFDHVLLCNVLHEINIKNWCQTLNKIKDSLKVSGSLILIEDMKMPKGEKIGDSGFLIMDFESLKELFSLKKDPIQLFSEDERYTERLLCTVILKSGIGVIDNNSINKALHILKKNILKKIKHLRGVDITDENKFLLGRESAFYSQLYINALISEDIISETDKVFDKVEIEASFDGGDESWKKYLKDNLNPNAPVNNGAPIGTYHVFVQFVVNNDGSIGEVKPLTSHGYGMEEEAIRVIKNGPKWKAAIQNGYQVKAYRKQPITFEVKNR